MEITLSIKKEDVMAEVAVTTAYAAAKMKGGKDAFDLIATVDEDEEHLERFWDECRVGLAQALAGVLAFEGMADEVYLPRAEAPSLNLKPMKRYKVRLDVSSAFDDTLLESMQLALFGYFAHGIAAKWYAYANKQEAAASADKAAALLDDLHRKALHKKRPARPTYND